MKKGWIAVFLIYADFRDGKGLMVERQTDDGLRSLFGDLVDVPLNNDTKVLVIINRVRYKPIEGTPIPTAGSNDQTFIYEVTRKPGKAKNKLKKYQPVSEANIAGAGSAHKDETLGKIFADIALKYPGRHVLLSTWDHGSAFGIFKVKETPEQIQLVKPFEGFKGKYIDLTDCAEALLADNDSIRQRPQPRLADDVWHQFNQPTYSYGSLKFRFKKATSPEFYKSFDALRADKAFNANVNLIFRYAINCLEFESKDPKNSIRNILTKGLTKEDTRNIVGNAFKQPGSPVESPGKLLFEIETEAGMAEMLTNEELGSAIQMGFGDPVGDPPEAPVDVLFMMNCTMMNVHTCYALQGRVNYLVAPQGIIAPPGYNYKAILEKITGSPGEPAISAEELAAECVTSTFIVLDPKRAAHKDDFARWALFSFRLAHFPRIADLVNELAECLLDNWRELRAQVANSRQVCFIFDEPNLNYYMVDISHFITILFENLNSQSAFNDKPYKKKIKDLHDKFVQERESMKIAEQEILGGIYKMDWPTSDLNTTLNASGLSIYFPMPLDIGHPVFKAFMAPAAPFPNAFMKSTPKWLALLEQLPDV